MAINYTNLFTNIGAIVKEMNTFRTDSKGLESRRDTLKSPFETNGNTRPVQGIYGTYNGFESNYARLSAELVGYITNSLTDLDDVIDALDLPDNSLTTVLDRLFDDMLMQSQTIKESVATVGSFSAYGTPVGNGSILTTQVMDGITAPSANVQSRPDYVGLTSEVTIDDVTTIRCIADEGDGLTPGQEQFQIHGQLAGEQWGPRDYGTGTGPSIQTAAALALNSNGSFDTVEDQNGTDVPSGWTIATGDETNVQSNASAYRGDYAVEIIGDAATANIRLEQDISLNDRGGYMVSFWLYPHTTSSIIVGVDGTGLDEKLTIDMSLETPATWVLKSFYFTIPFTAPTDAKIYIQASGTWGGTVTAKVDDLFILTPTWHNGVGYVIVPGSTNFRRRDTWQSTITVVRGLFQDKFREAYGIQMPSATSPTISDSLAQ